MPKRYVGVLAASAAAMMVCAGSASAATTSFTNSTAIIVPALGSASPYPSSVNVTGLLAPVSDVNVRLNNFSHNRPFDLGIVIVGPAGPPQAIELMDGGTQTAASVLQITFDDAGAQWPDDPTALASGSYRPRNDFLGEYPSPGPIFNYGNPGPYMGGTDTLASTFNGAAPNGTWSIFVRDFVAANTGYIGGWTLTLETADPPAQQQQQQQQTTTKKKCKQGKSKKGAAAAKKKCKKKGKKKK